MTKKLVAVIGGHKTDTQGARLAEAVGLIVAEAGCILVCGGLTGIMEHAAKGAKAGGGITVGLLPGQEKSSANPYIDIPLATGLGFTRNTLVVGVADIVIALPGREGTLSEIGFALSGKKPVIGMRTWKIPGVIPVRSIGKLKSTLTKLLQRVS